MKATVPFYVGIRLDLFKEMITRIENDEELKKMYGDKVSERLGFASLGNDFQIVSITPEGETPKDLSDEENKIIEGAFNRALDAIVDKIPEIK